MGKRTTNAITDEQIFCNELRGLEEALWRTETRFDDEFMNNILDKDFIEYGRSGVVYSRADCLALPRQEIIAKLPLEDFHVSLLSEEVAQVTYISEVGSDKQRALRSSLWVSRQMQWKLWFHQGTPTK